MHATIVLTHAVSHSYALLRSNIYYSETHLLVCTKIICIFILIKSKSIEFNIILV